MKHSTLANLTKWQIDAYGLALCLVVTAGAWFAGVSPLLSQRAAAAARREELAEKSQESSRLAAQARQLSNQLAALRHDLDEVRVELQPAARVNQRLAEVTAAAGECGLELNDVRPGRAVVGPRHTIVPIDVSGTGSYTAVAHFIRSFHERFGDSGIAAIELASAGAATSAGTAGADASASFYLRLHWFVKPQAPTAAAR